MTDPLHGAVDAARMTDQPKPPTPEEERRRRWLVPMTQAEVDALEGVYFYDDGYVAADDVQRLRATVDAARATPETALTGSLFYRAWLRSGRPDPLPDDGGWEGFALTVQALIRIDRAARIPRADAAVADITAAISEPEGTERPRCDFDCDACRAEPEGTERP